MELARSGDCQAFDRLCRLHGDRLLRHAMGLCARESEAGDLVQETLIRAWRSLDRFEFRCRFFTWLCGILINTHRNHQRRWWPVAFALLNTSQKDQADALMNNVASGTASPAEDLEGVERATMVLGSLNRLPRHQREVVYLRFYADASLDEIARLVDCPVGTVKSRLFKGLEELGKLKMIREERKS